MRTPLEQMTREQLLAELPKRFVAMAVLLAALCIVVAVMASSAKDSGFAIGWISAIVAGLLASPFLVARVARWMVAPARERLERRRASMHRALEDFSFTGGDSRV
ncbi:MAG: hypothetical protein KIT83_07855 [Bryobacterales bacterium]|nr:hypothetical protein [Bryobacterales bacterium]